MYKFIFLIALFPSISTIVAAEHLQDQLAKLSMQEGFTISVYTDQVPGARSLSISPDGVLYVGTRQSYPRRQNIGKVYAVVDTDDDGLAETVHTVAEGLNVSNGVAFHQGSLYIAELNRVIRIDNVETDLGEQKPFTVINDDFPSDMMHGWKYLGIGPDNRIYVPVGAPCNICDRGADGYSNIQVMNLDGSDKQVYARGIRNTVGFDWHPDTGELWFTDNGSDGMGDELPNDELNHAPEQGMHFGYPFCHEGSLPDKDFGVGVDCGSYQQPVAKMGPHVAAIGMRFYTGEQFPETLRNQPIVALHGSWNRTKEAGHTGYKVVAPRIDENNQFIEIQTLVEGWLEEDNSYWGRPVDIEMAPDGSVYISDDLAGVIYKLSYISE